MCWYTKENGEFIYHSELDESSLIEELDMSVRAWHFYYCRGIKTIRDLICHDGWFFINLDYFSVSIFTETVKCLERAGFRISDYNEDAYPSVESYVDYFHDAYRQRIEAAEKEEKRLERNSRARIRYRERKACGII